MKTCPGPGERAVIVVNHVSFLDAVLLAAFLPGKPTFAIHTRIARAWWVRPFLGLFEAFPVDPTNPMSAKAMVRAVKEGRTLVIFPEGRITVTGALMKVFDGPGMVADKGGCADRPGAHRRSPIFPLLAPPRQGAASHLPEDPTDPPAAAAIRDRRRDERPRAPGDRRPAPLRRNERDDLRHLQSDRTLFEALLDARRIHGGKAAVVEDVKRAPLSYNRLIAASLALARPLARMQRARARRSACCCPTSRAWR